MILADTSAWVEYLRDTGSPACETVDHHLRSGQLATCSVVRMEVLAGARDDAHLVRLERLLGRALEIDIWSGDYDFAAMLHRSCRRQGVTIRRLLDCLIAAVAIRENVPVLHADRDFDALARLTPLRSAL